MGQSHPIVRTTGQSKARRLGGGIEFFSTHELTVFATRVVCPGNLAALKPPLSVCTKNRTHAPSHKFAVPQPTTSQHSFTLVVNKMWTVQAYLANYSYTGTIVSPFWHDELMLWCYPCLICWRGLHNLSNSWASLWITITLQLLVVTSTHTFIRTLDTTQLDVLFIQVIYTRDSAFTTTRLESYMLFPLQ